MFFIGIAVMEKCLKNYKNLAQILLKILQKLGLFKEYRWAFSFDDLVLGIGRNGPAVLGINWYEGMGTPDGNNFIAPTGAHVGGHAILARAVDEHPENANLWRQYREAEDVLRQVGANDVEDFNEVIASIWRDAALRDAPESGS